MKTNLPERITTLEEAQKYLRELVQNGESYHPDDPAADSFKEPPAEAEQMDILMGQIFDLPDCDADGEFPYGFIMKEERKWRLKDSDAVFLYKDKTGRGFTHKMQIQQLLEIADDVSWNDRAFLSSDSLHAWAEDAEEGDEWENAAMKFIRL